MARKRLTPFERVQLGALFLAGVVIVAVAAYRAAGRTWLDALYMVVITVSSVGYGERSELGAFEQLVTIGVIVFGISAAVFSLGGLVQMAIEGEVDRALRLGRNTRAIDHLHGHVILCGHGRLGKLLAHELHAKKQPFVVVDIHPDAVADALEHGYLALAGDATEENTLQSAGIERARCLVTALSSDAANVFITLTSRNLNRGLQIIARGELQSTQKKLIQAGADRVVLPATIGAQRIAAMITHPSTVELMELVAGRSVLDVEVDEFTIPEDCRLIGMSILSAETRHKHGLLVVAVKKLGGHMVFNPEADLRFSGGDVLIVMGRINDIERFRREYSIR